jgi:arabinogalactan oligomer/maltooligosaccharide transport system permease protein
MLDTTASKDVTKAVAEKKEGIFSFLSKKDKTGSGQQLTMGTQILFQILLVLVSFTVLFPILWIVSMSFDSTNRPTTLRLIPEHPTLDAYVQVVKQPTNNPISFAQLAWNSFRLSAGTTLVSILIGVFAAYSFSRFHFKGREQLMVGIITVLMLPSIATIAPLFVLLNQVKIGDFNLRNSLFGVGLAMVSGALPFTIWNLKGYLDTVPKELEEAAIIDGAGPNQTFFLIILPLAIPALAVTGFLGFMSGWTEFFLSWQFLTDPKDFTLAMALWNMTGQYAGSVPWSRFAAMSIMVAFPVSVVYLSLQRYIVGGLTVGGVKG